MAELATTFTTNPGGDYISLAREIARDMNPIQTILDARQINANEWERIQANPHFQRVLSAEVEAWQSANNVGERVRLKALHFVEEALPEFFQRAHDPRETLNAKTEVLKTITRLAGIGNSMGETGAMGEKFSVTINLGADQTLKIEKTVTHQVIDGVVE
ncbi:MAG: hypothetical protein NTY94_23560 [Alphaproteobacteria bacterium]|nr:hypothetical protein [Alphaproteobacteria bacterium]